MDRDEVIRRIDSLYTDASLSDDERRSALGTLADEALAAEGARHRSEAERKTREAATWRALAQDYHRRLMLALSFMPRNAQQVVDGLPDLNNPPPPEQLFVQTSGAFPGTR